MFSLNDRHFNRCDTTLRQDTLEVWNDAVDFVNQINTAIIGMPMNSKRDLKMKIMASAVRISDHVAKASRSYSSDMLEERLREAVEAVHETMALLYIAKQWNYVAAENYQDLFEKGRSMVEQLCLFGGFVYTRREAN